MVKSLSSDIHPDCEKMYHNNVQSMTCNPYVIMHLQNMSSCLGFSLRGMRKERKEKACNDGFVFFSFFISTREMQKSVSISNMSITKLT